LIDFARLRVMIERFYNHMIQSFVKKKKMIKSDQSYDLIP